MTFDFRKAEKRDNGEIRSLLSESPMPGRVTVSFEREPDYFLGTSVMGDICRVYTAREHISGELAMIGCWSFSDHYLDGKKTRVGYIGQLRVKKKYQGRMLPASGWRFFRETLKPEDPDLFFTVIARENSTARKVFTGNSGIRFPVLHRIDTICTCAVMVGRKRRRKAGRFAMEEGSRRHLPEMIDFLHTWGSRRELFPVYRGDDFLSGGRTRGFALEDMIFARAGSEIAGVAGLWDQSGYKQSVLRSYSGLLRAARPLYNLAAPCMGRPVLPKPGSRIDEVYGAFICIRESDPEVFDAILAQLYDKALQRGYRWLLLGLASRDPLLKRAVKYPHLLYTADLFMSSISGGSSDSPYPLLKGVPYIEIAAL